VPVPADPAPWSAIVLTGGTGRRLGGTDKAGLELRGASLLDHLVDGLPATVPVVVAGPDRPVNRPVHFRPEQPPGGGPVAGIASGVPAIETPYVVILAVDLPWSGPVAAELVAELAAGDVDAIIPLDAGGRRQLLCAAWRTGALVEALARLGDPVNRSVRELLDGCTIRDWIPSDPHAQLLADIDTYDDLARELRRSVHWTPEGEPGAG
jgi:molybdopterin-guanine dinucleotide biosynthesis protein A